MKILQTCAVIILLWRGAGQAQTPASNGPSGAVATNALALDYTWLVNPGWYRSMTNGNWAEGRSGHLPFPFSNHRRDMGKLSQGGVLVGCSIAEEQEFYSRTNRPFALNSDYDFLSFYKTQQNYYGLPAEKQITEIAHENDTDAAMRNDLARLDDFQKKHAKEQHHALIAKLWQNARAIDSRSEVVLVLRGYLPHYDFTNHGFSIWFGRGGFMHDDRNRTSGGVQMDYEHLPVATGLNPNLEIIFLYHGKLKDRELIPVNEAEGEKMIRGIGPKPLAYVLHGNSVFNQDLARQADCKFMKDYKIDPDRRFLFDVKNIDIYQVDFKSTNYDKLLSASLQ